jgi:hypothetical protein
MTTGYGLNSLSSIPGRGKIFLLIHSVQADSEAHITFYTMVTGDFFPRVNAAGS